MGMDKILMSLHIFRLGLNFDWFTGSIIVADTCYALSLYKPLTGVTEQGCHSLNHAHFYVILPEHVCMEFNDIISS